MAKYGLLIDENRCNGCYACFLACRDEFCGNDYLPYSAAQPYSGHFWMKVVERERGTFPKVKVAYTSIPCMHCDNAPCIRPGDDAVYKRPDGIVIIDPVRAVGRQDLLSTCPYQVIYWNEESTLPQKCTLCAHLLDKGWIEPRCVEVCPNNALIFGDLSDPNSEISKRLEKDKAEILNPEYGLKERVKYIGLAKSFVAGTAIFGDTDKCAENVTVTITGAGNTRKVKTNNYGDFEFEGLPNGTEYTVQMEHSGYRTRRIAVSTELDLYLGDIILSRT